MEKTAWLFPGQGSQSVGMGEDFYREFDFVREIFDMVAEITKIRTDHLRALEEGNFDAFSAPVYIRGFVRTCSTLLKLDVPQVMATLEEELRHTEKFAGSPAARNTALIPGPPLKIFPTVGPARSAVSPKAILNPANDRDIQDAPAGCQGP